MKKQEKKLCKEMIKHTIKEYLTNPTPAVSDIYYYKILPAIMLINPFDSHSLSITTSTIAVLDLLMLSASNWLENDMRPYIRDKFWVYREIEQFRMIISEINRTFCLDLFTYYSIPKSERHSIRKEGGDSRFEYDNINQWHRNRASILMDNRSETIGAIESLSACETIKELNHSIASGRYQSSLYYFEHNGKCYGLSTRGSNIDKNFPMIQLFEFVVTETVRGYVSIMRNITNTFYNASDLANHMLNYFEITTRRRKSSIAMEPVSMSHLINQGILTEQKNVAISSYRWKPMPYFNGYFDSMTADISPFCGFENEVARRSPELPRDCRACSSCKDCDNNSCDVYERRHEALQYSVSHSVAAMKVLQIGYHGGKQSFICKHDSTIENGFEVVSMPFDKKSWTTELAEDINKACKSLLKDGYRGDDAEGCGLHFHYSRPKKVNKYQFNENLVRYYDSWTPTLQWINRRSAGSLFRNNRGYYGTDKRCLQVNFCNSDTIEFRGPKASLIPETIIGTQMLYRSIMEYVEAGTKQNLSLPEITSAHPMEIMTAFNPNQDQYVQRLSKFVGKS